MSCFIIIFFFFFQAEDGIRDWSVTGVQTCALPICPTRGETLGVTRAVAIFIIEVEQALLELLALHGEPPLEAEEIFGPQEEPPVSALRPGEPQGFGEPVLCLERTVPPNLRRSHGRQGGGRSDPLEQRRLPRAILPHETGHARREVERRHGSNGRHGKRERRLARGRALLQADREKMGHGAY